MYTDSRKFVLNDVLSSHCKKLKNADTTNTSFGELNTAARRGSTLRDGPS
jgi:hypothetical protein